jgi:hypothetical protein
MNHEIHRGVACRRAWKHCRLPSLAVCGAASYRQMQPAVRELVPSATGSGPLPTPEQLVFHRSSGTRYCCNSEQQLVLRWTRRPLSTFTAATFLLLLYLDISL